MRIHLILKAHIWQITPPPLPSHLSACHAPSRCLAGDSQVFMLPFLVPQRGDAGLSLRSCSCSALLEATQKAPEGSIKATTGSHQQHLKHPYGESQAMLCVPQVAERGLWQVPTSTAVSMTCSPVSSREHLARVDWIETVHLTQTGVDQTVPTRNYNH